MFLKVGIFLPSRHGCSIPNIGIQRPIYVGSKRKRTIPFVYKLPSFRSWNVKDFLPDYKRKYFLNKANKFICKKREYKIIH